MELNLGKVGSDELIINVLLWDDAKAETQPLQICITSNFITLRHPQVDELSLRVEVEYFDGKMNLFYAGEADFPSEEANKVVLTSDPAALQLQVNQYLEGQGTVD